MTTTADIFNTPNEIEYTDEAGQKHTYKLKQLTKGNEAKFSRWLEKRARDDAARALQEMPQEAAESYAAGTRQDIAAGVYEWGSAVCVKSLRSPAGQQYAIYLALLDEHPDMEEELAAKIYAQQRQRIQESLFKAIEDADPKVLAALRRLVNIPGGPQSSSAIPRSTGDRGKSRKSRKRK